MKGNLNISNRTKILSCAAVILAIICAVQFLLGLRTPQKNFTVKGEADCISIESAGKSLVLQKNGGDWYCESERLDNEKVERMAKTFSPLTTLGTTSRSTSQSALERYGLDEPIAVTAKSKGKELISFLVGKDSSGGSQAYVQVNGKKEIYLAKGSLRTIWSADLESLKAAKAEEEKKEGQGNSASEEI